MEKANKILGIQKKDGHYYITTDGPDFKLYFMTDDIIRLRGSFDKNFDEESYVLTMTAWEDRLDGFLGEERTRIHALDVEYVENTTSYVFQTKTMILKMHKKPFGIEIYNNKNEKIYSDLMGRAFVRDHLTRVFHYNEILEGDHYYGFGETTGELDKYGRFIKYSNRDAKGFDPVNTSCLYKHIPFYIKLNKHTKNALGIFYHNSYEASISINNEISAYWPKYSYYQADGGDLDIFFMNGPSIANVVKRYTDLTGKSVLPPKYSLGYLGSTMYYTELEKDCDKEILNFVKKCKLEDFPIEGYHLSSGYTSGADGKRYVFTWNNKKFPSPKKFFSEMNNQGVVVSPNVKPGVLTTHPLFKEMEAYDVFVKESNTDEPCIGVWWGGPATYFDFTNPKAREFWKKSLIENIVEQGTTAIWNDNCEYEGLEDKQAKCFLEGKGSTIGQQKPIMANLMAKLGYEAVLEVYPNKRPFILTRGGFAGIQRYTTTWNGDNYTSWESLKYNIATMLGIGLSGVAITGCDVGGFDGSAPESELFVRWVQNGIFSPRFSIHSSNTDNTVTEPWMYPDVVGYIRDAFKLRYSLIPYYYSLMYDASITGEPILRPLVYEFQDDIQCYKESVVYMVGKSLLVANVVEESAKEITVYLPKGSNWLDYYTYEKYKGGQTITIPVSLGSIPLFIRDTGIIPRTKDIQSIKTDEIEYLDILIGNSRDSSFVMYEDDGISNEYSHCYLKTHIKVKAGEKMTISFKHEGTYQSKVKKIKLEIPNKDRGLLYVNVNEKAIQQYIHKDQWEKSEEGWYYDTQLRSAQIKYDAIHTDYQIIVSFEIFDLSGPIYENL